MKRLIIILLLFASPVWAANFYCDCSVSGGTGGAGTYADPFESIADIEAYEAATGFTDGDDIYFLEGSTCTATSDLDINWEGVDGDNYSIFGCYDGEDDFDCDGTRPLITLNGGAGILNAAIDISYVRFEHLHLKDVNSGWEDSGSIGISFNSGNNGNGDEGYITITDCELTNLGHYAIELKSVGLGIIVTNNIITESGNAIYIIDESGDGPSYGYIAGNTCTDIVGYYSSGLGYKVDGHCVALQVTDYYIVENNTATDAYNGAFALWVATGYDSIHNVIRGNKNNGSRQCCVDVYHDNSSGTTGSFGNLVYQNICQDSANSDSVRPALRLNNMKSSNGNYFFNNTVYDANAQGTYNRRATDYSYWLNNIVVTDNLATDSELFGTECNGSQGSNHEIDYNIWWSIVGDPSSSSLWKTPDDCTAMTWANWKADGWGGNDFVTNPLFAETTNLTLQSGSPAIDAGTFLTYITSTSGSGTTPSVNNTYILHGNFGLKDETGATITGMEISLFDTVNGIQNREITSVSYGSTITLNSSVNWIYDAGHPTDPDYTTQIALRFTGSAPDIGAYEYPQAEDDQPKAIEGLILE